MNLKHIAVIMDGNGRWAKLRGAARSAGHREGLETAKKIVKAASDMGIDFITLYVFSSENWKRTKTEVGFLMNLIEKHLLAEFEFYKANNIRIRHIGDLSALPVRVQTAIKTACAETDHFTGTSVVLAINYGGQDEIFRAAQKYCAAFIQTHATALQAALAEHKTDTFLQNAFNEIPSADFVAHLDTYDIPPVDLLIRTGGEKRLSNFLLYQAAYAELYFSDTLWPDWTADDLQKAIANFEKRDRRFGKA